MKRTIVIPTEYLDEHDTYRMTPDTYHEVCGDWNDGIKVNGDKVAFDFESDIEEYSRYELRIAELEVPEEVYETVKTGKHECMWKPCTVVIKSIRDFEDEDFLRISKTEFQRNNLS